MKIAATMIGMDAAHTYTEVALHQAGRGSEPQTSPFSPPRGDFKERFSSLVSTINTRSTSTRPPEVEDVEASSLQESDSGSFENEELISELTGAATGRSVTVKTVSSSVSSSLALGNGSPMYAGSASVNSVSMYTRQEVVQYSAAGSVITEDGRSIDFHFGLEMQRNVSVVNTRAAVAPLPFFIDPLVLNFGTGVPFGGDSWFSFDLNADGDDEKLACPACGCGFLAFDRNLDGLINNGLELFGPRTGFGFDELAAFDEDANLWIDENDPVFDRLSVWMKGDSQEDTLMSLKEAGVGAISLAHAGSRFILEDGEGNTVGNVKANSIFLTEDGQVRSLQEIDLADQDEEQEVSFAAGELDSAWQGAMETFRAIIDRQLFHLRMLLAGRRAAEDGERLSPRLMKQVSSTPASPGESEIQTNLNRIIENA